MRARTVLERPDLGQVKIVDGGRRADFGALEKQVLDKVLDMHHK